MSKFLYVSHRGNLSGPNPSRENQPNYINKALSLGYHVEIDVWLSGNNYYLGHDKPEYIVSQEYLLTPNLWIHCKNLAAINALIIEPEINCFAHDKDDYVLTSHSYLWCFPKIQTLTSNCIAVLPERVPGWRLDNCAGICSDYVEKYKSELEDSFFEHVEIKY